MAGITGLNNLGNTCYLNSIIQCLSNCESFRNYLLSDEFLKLLTSFKVKNNTNIKNLLIYQFYRLIKKIWLSNSNELEPISFKKLLGEKYSIFNNYDQNDSQEVLITLLSTFYYFT